MPHRALERVADAAKASMGDGIRRLGELLAIPAISSDPAHADDVRRLAETVRDELARVGLARARLLELDGAHPCVAAEWTRHGAARPTVLIYGHLDVQPVAGERWHTPPHTATRKPDPDGDGERLYGRGAADDMGGWLGHLLALEAWLTEAGELPCNVKLLIESEEEIGSPNLERFMDAFPDAFVSDVMVLTDCENPSTAIPGLTVSLRGLLEVEVTCESATGDVHSGLWGNLVPDPALALVALLARLVDADGRLRLGRRPVDPAWLDASRTVPLDDAVIRKGADLLPDVAPLPPGSLSPAAWAWRQPAVTVLSTTLPAPGQEKNAIRGHAGAVLSFRVAPGQTGDELFALVREELTRDPPGGVRVRVVARPGGASSWDYQPRGEAFVLADRAYRTAWGRPLLPIGVGGSIPFVALFGRRFGDLPLILNGVMDPETRAHGPNESLHLGVFEKAVVANVHLLDELATLGR